MISHNATFLTCNWSVLAQIPTARKSDHSFKNRTEEELSLIYNYPIVYTGLVIKSFVQCYFLE